ncbi:hypothetical protein [Clostridium paridis]|uniref:DUF7922 domain-containing protein n=1 Tax=Clostridium paridis TaxID=2803863 RepID=A0A937K4E0_9CLOT|nr:hypothetical protein [Clostridium paridis]MBL4931438.1 hypothetical protein [Clostridium paridis]
MAHGKLYRSFIILQEDEKGHSIAEDKPLSGYAKIEAKDERCKISFYAQNIKKDGHKHYMVLISGKKDNKQIINLGEVNITDIGKVEVSTEYLADNIGGVGISYDKVSGAAIYKDLDGKKMFLITGFMSGEQPKDKWKDYKITRAQGVEEIKLENRIKDVEQVEVVEKVKSAPEKVEVEDMREEEALPIAEESKNVEEVEEIKVVSEEETREEKPVIQEEEEVKESSNQFVVEEPINDVREEENPFDKYEESLEAQSYEEEFRIQGTVGEFFESLAEDFEMDRHKNKKNDIKHTKWYKVYIASLDDMTNITDYNKYTVIYYPMINYYPYFKKYGHYNIGYKCNKKGKMQYIIYGIPGKKDKSDQPYGGKTGFVTWMEDETLGKDLGYWLMFYDFRNSVIVIPTEN